ncbi:carboxypeptidase-like regulatory domain-containing protein [Flavobacterium aestivum]|uniref:carboxypeptidase-like regulatory domain-containing protein n=1 Tax=Flavobacterium aestivum TaxID=3003257 RepID=UPI002482BCBB|nr:carboxypeptidase-like regulatory domain-containing protein [Flavobacterium aestivum]
MRVLITILSLVFSLNSVAQIVNGTIFNEKKIPLSDADVYLDGTTISATSDKEGHFSLDYNYEANNVLVISCPGYQTIFLSSFDSKKELNILMKPLLNKLNEVVITRNDKFTRKEKLQLFRRFFLGETINALNTFIQNEDDIYFKYDKENYILKAFSDKPLIILNTSLGYKINYELVTFEVNFNSLSVKPDNAVKCLYQGFSRFVETNNSNEVLAKREKTFQGSQVHFFRDLSNNILGKDKFLIYSNQLAVNPNTCFKVIKEGEDLIKVEILPQKAQKLDKGVFASFDIEYDDREQSKIIFETNTFYIYKYGNNSNIGSITFLGDMSEKKMGDTLPLNYGIL